MEGGYGMYVQNIACHFKSWDMVDLDMEWDKQMGIR